MNKLLKFIPGDLLIDSEGEIGYITEVLSMDNKKRIYVKFFKETNQYIYAHYELAGLIIDINKPWKHLPPPPLNNF